MLLQFDSLLMEIVTEKYLIIQLQGGLWENFPGYDSNMQTIVNTITVPPLFSVLSF